MKPQRVCIRWIDARSKAGDYPAAVAKVIPAVEMFSSGPFVNEDEENVRFAEDTYQEGDGEQRFREVSVIPKSFIRFMKIEDWPEAE